MDIITSGRTDVADYSQKSGMRYYKTLNQTPFLAFLVSNETVEIRIVKNSKDLLKLPDDVKVMAQWRGEWRSNFFQFTVGKLRQHCIDNPPSNLDIVYVLRALDIET
jgi:hypothetical protein